MSQTKGFTIIELLFVLAIICSVTLLTLPTVFQSHRKQNMQVVEYNVMSIIQQAKSSACTYHQDVKLNLKSDRIAYAINGKETYYKLPTGYSLSNIKEIYFNQNGNINQANHINLNHGNTTKRIIFHLGSGEVTIEK